jgi:hypothetical protein
MFWNTIKGEKMKIINLTQHKATPEQVVQGVVDLPQGLKKLLSEALTFVSVPDKEILDSRANTIYEIAVSHILNVPFNMVEWDINYDAEIKAKGDFGFMIGGAPYLMPYLEEVLRGAGTPLYAFSKRESIEVKEGDTVIKKSVFKHIGFVEGGLI